MDLVGVNVIETAALGRPFQLGMLYDCRKDALVPGITLWDKEQLKKRTCSHPQINTVYKVTASDSTEEKLNVLNIDGRLELSLLGGLINVNGAAKYLNDTKKSFKQQRLTLLYHSTSKFEELTMNHLASKNISHHEVFDNDAATHVVTGVLYGADACFVFDREVSSDEDKSTVEGEVKAVFDKLKGISVDANIDLNMNDKQKTAFTKFSCMFYGDFQLPSNPTSFEDALKIYAELPKMLGEKKELVVPLRVWLYPLDKLHTRAAKLQKDISIGLIKDIESVIESLNTTEMKCNDLLNETATLSFVAFHDKIQQMKQNCHNYKLSVIEKLGSLLPKIRGDLEKETALIDLLHDHSESPFRRSELEQWVEEKERESDIIKTLVRQLKDLGAKVEVNLDESLMDLEVKNLVCYTFTSFEWPDVLLSQQKAYLSPSSERKNDESIPDSTQKIRLTDDIKRSMRSNLQLFKNLINSKDCKPAKFVVESKEMKNYSGSCILLYENDCDKAVVFNPPLKPAAPITEQIRYDSVVLKVPPSCPHTVELRLLYKMKEEKDWKSHQVPQGQNTVTLTDLVSDIEYEIKCAAVGKLNYTVESDIITIRVINKNIIRAIESIIENLSLTENKCSQLLEDSRAETFSAFHKKISDMRRHCQTYKQELNDRIKSLIQSVQACEKEMCDLTDVIQAHKESPFNENALDEWITVKETEMNTTDEFLQNLLDAGAEVQKSLDDVLSDFKEGSLVCFTFSSLEQSDVLLSEQENYLKSEIMKRNLEKTPHAPSQTWLTKSNKEKMREHVEIFKELMTLHGSQTTTFIVSSKDHQNHPGSCIILYENGCDEAVCFNPPSKPACPIIEQISDDNVVLKIPPSCPHSVELRLLYKMKEEKDWKYPPVGQGQDIVTLNDLRSVTEYEIKFAAVGKLNYIINSDVTKVVRKV
nr:stonustoxin subunit beta-like [Misgurnus anguillicaudatus]